MARDEGDFTQELAGIAEGVLRFIERVAVLGALAVAAKRYAPDAAARIALDLTLQIGRAALLASIYFPALSRAARVTANLRYAERHPNTVLIGFAACVVSIFLLNIPLGILINAIVTAFSGDQRALS